MQNRRELLKAASAAAGLAAAGVLIGGESATAAPRPAAAGPAVTATRRLRSFTDASGLVNVAVFSYRGSPPQSHWNDQTIRVADGDMVAIGGGAIGAEHPQGALLTASYPNDDLSGWTVSTKDHVHAQPHELTAYVIGLKIAGLSRAQLLQHIHVARADSGTAPHPEAEAGIPSSTEYALVGGGFRVNWHGDGNLGTATFPSTGSSWKSRSKDHLVSDPASIRSFAISLRRNLPVGRVLNTIARSDSGQVAHPSAVATLPPGYALTGGGAEVRYRGDGVLLWRLEPSVSASPSFSASAKDHGVSDTATLTAYALGIRIA
ncbi:hypothetical protein [Streptomyces sp. G45]|uniref:hypothetical protein n=1 Tax=Streptomyces sp. G45 TaxID=3406627 RepID=UPI003C25A614